MRSVSVTELKNRLSHYLRLVKRGESLTVVEHSVPIASVQAITAGGGAEEDRTARLIREGLANPPRSKPYKGFLKHPPLPCKVDAAAILIEERGDR